MVNCSRCGKRVWFFSSKHETPKGIMCSPCEIEYQKEQKEQKKKEREIKRLEKLKRDTIEREKAKERIEEEIGRKKNEEEEKLDKAMELISKYTSVITDKVTALYISKTLKNIATNRPECFNKAVEVVQKYDGRIAVRVTEELAIIAINCPECFNKATEVIQKYDGETVAKIAEELKTLALYDSKEFYRTVEAIQEYDGETAVRVVAQKTKELVTGVKQACIRRRAIQERENLKKEYSKPKDQFVDITLIQSNSQKFASKGGKGKRKQRNQTCIDRYISN